MLHQIGTTYLIQHLIKMKKLLIAIGYFPALWILIYLVFIISVEFFNDNYYIGKLTLFMFFINLQIIWIWFITVIIYFIIYQKIINRNVIYIYSISVILFFMTLRLDPGEYFKFLLG